MKMGYEMQSSRDIILETHNLVKYFPVYEKGILRRKLIGHIRAVDGVSLKLYKGEIFGLVGESGCGKTTFGRVVLNLIPPTSGEVSFNGTKVFDIKNREADLQFRKQAQLIFQDPYLSLNPRMTVSEIVGEPFIIHKTHKKRIWERDPLYYYLSLNTIWAFLSLIFLALGIVSDTFSAAISQTGPEFMSELALVLFSLFNLLFQIFLLFILLNSGIFILSLLSFITPAPYTLLLSLPIPLLLILCYILCPIFYYSFRSKRRIDQQERRRQVIKLLNLCGLEDYHALRYSHEFSGGQRQRIGIARSLAVQPQLIIADEPVSALDVAVQAQILNLLKDIRKQFNLTYIFIAHDLSVVRHISDRIAVMYLGKIVELAPAEEFVSTPRHPYTEALISAIPIPDPTKDRKRIILPGDVESPLNPPSGCRFRTRCLYSKQKCADVEPEMIEISPGHLVACHYPIESKQII